MNDIDREIVATYYIECELDNIIASKNLQLTESAKANLPRLLEALSFTYRANLVFDYVMDERFTWEKRIVRVDDVTLTAMGEFVTPIIYSPEVQRSPRKMATYIKQHPDDEHMQGLRYRPVPENRQIILMRQDGDKIKMLDGSHRFLSLVMEGKEFIEAYIAKPANSNAKPMLGDAVFLRLRLQWQATDDPELKRAIEQTARGLVDQSSDGQTAISAYWVSMVHHTDVKAAGLRILGEI